jgi:hypothetical protein
MVALGAGRKVACVGGAVVRGSPIFPCLHDPLNFNFNGFRRHDCEPPSNLSHQLVVVVIDELGGFHLVDDLVDGTLSEANPRLAVTAGRQGLGGSVRARFAIFEQRGVEFIVDRGRGVGIRVEGD